MPLTPAIHHLEGTAKVNGRDAKVGTPVALGDRISTGSRSQAVFVSGATHSCCGRTRAWR
jgi:hypothetical protein